MKMKRRHQKLYIILSVLFLVFLVVPLSEAKRSHLDYGPAAKFLPSNGEAYGWIKDLWKMGYDSEIGFRQPGSPADHEAAEYIEQKFKEFGLKDVARETVDGWQLWTPQNYELAVTSGGIQESIPCGYRPYTAFTGAGGIQGEMVYVGTGMSDENFQGVAGKVVLVDLIAPGLDSDPLMGFSPFVYDPAGTLPGTKTTQNWPSPNLVVSYEKAVQYGAIGYIGILNFLTPGMKDYYSPYDGALKTIPGVYVSRDKGDYLKGLLSSGPVESTITLEGTLSPGTTHNVVGFLPGKTDEIILITSHYDGWAANEGSGISIVMSLAEYFSSRTDQPRQRTLMFLAAGGHFLGDLPTRTFISAHPDLLDKMMVSISTEMIGKEYIEVDEEFVPTGLVSPRAVFISGPPFQVNPTLLSYAEDSIQKYDLERTVVLPANGPLGESPPGVAHWWFLAGLPIMHIISAPAHQFTPDDTPNKVAVDQLRPVTAAFADIVEKIDASESTLK